MIVEKIKGVDGDYIKVTIAIDGNTYTRHTAPNGSNRYANIGGRNNVSIRAGGKMATVIDKAIKVSQSN